MVAEADLHSPADHAAIAHALQRRATLRGVTLAEQILSYVSALKPSHKPTPRTRWVLQLDEHGTRPQAFPADLRWDDCRGAGCVPRRDAWLATLDRARAFLRGELPDVCPGAQHWGSPSRALPDHARAAKAMREGRWVRAQCSERTANRFYRVVGARESATVIDAAVASGGVE